jgi:hypothetical protein
LIPTRSEPAGWLFLLTNYSEGLDQVHKPVTCKLWDHVDLDADDTPLTADGRRRLVAPAWEPATR